MISLLTKQVSELTSFAMKPKEKSLLRIFKQLPPEQQQTVLSFAEFLHNQENHGSHIIPAKIQPIAIPRPQNESVIAAMKRLSASYPMLEKSSLLNETSALMAQHIMQGKEATLVIDELEAVFIKQYEKLVADSNSSDIPSPPGDES